MKLILREVKKPVRVFTDPRYLGVDVDYEYIDTLPTIEIPLNKIKDWEVHKTDTQDFKKQVDEMVLSIKNGLKLQPIIVRKTGLFNNNYTIIDGHHRVYAYRQMGLQTIPAKIVPSKDIKKQGGVPTLEY